MRRGALLLAALALGACGGDRPQGVEVTEAPPESELRARPGRPAPLDTVYADSGLFVDPRLRPDSLRADSLRRDSLRADSLRQAQAARPDFRPFWPDFVRAVRTGPEAVAALTVFSERLPRDAFDATLYPAAFEVEAFRAGLLDLTARDFRREGTRRVVTVTVGYDAAGAVVPEDEAVTESAVILTFDVVDSAYRLVRIDLAG